jgi:hypothetical protein
MKKLILFAAALALGACAFPSTPSEGDLVAGTRQYRPELFASGARGQVIMSISDNVSSSGFFGKKYRDVAAFKNVQNGTAFYLDAKLGDKDFAAAMLPIGKYEITNLYMEYIYTTTQRNGNTTIITTNIETHSHFEGKNKITFDVKPGEVAYLGNIELVKGENAVDNEGAKLADTFKITDDSAGIPDARKTEWEKEFGRPFIVRLPSVNK